MALTTGAIRVGLLLALGLLSCKSDGAGLAADAPINAVRDGGEAGSPASDVPASDDGGTLETAAAAETDPGPSPVAPPPPVEPPVAPPVLDPTLETEPPRAIEGPPLLIGCADGTREGFVDRGRWTKIAGCAGGFRVPGLQGNRAYAPQCKREAGNTGANPAGVGCSVADLCAEGWQVCEDPAALVARTQNGCEEAIPEGFALFFLVRSGASVAGICVPGSGWQNDLHGCGSFGTPTHESCAPLDRRLSFSACQATAGIWSCGDADTHLQETALVSKAGPALGGVLCCRDD